MLAGASAWRPCYGTAPDRSRLEQAPRVQPTGRSASLRRPGCQTHRWADPTGGRACRNVDAQLTAASSRLRMDPPACVLIDDDPALLNRLTRDLQHRFDRDYELVPVQDAQGGLATLERLRTAGGRVALVVADLQMADVAGVELLCRARSLHPLAKRALLIDYLDFHRNESMHRALTLGQADC